METENTEEVIEAVELTDREQALANYLELEPDDYYSVTESRHNEKYVEYGNQEYLVLTDYEADAEFKERCESYVDECLLPECPEAMRGYFDYEAFERDCRISDGRGHVIASYDGEENEVKLGETWFYIYRIN